jgi:phosphatidylglycerophosphatase C
VGVAAFDFDGTLLPRDSFLPFLVRVKGYRSFGSAAIRVYLAPLGRLLGFDAVLATRLEVGEGGLLTGRLQGVNCRGCEKELRLRSWLAASLGDAAVELWAYGDSAGDRELLAMADHPSRVSRRQRSRT